MWVWMVVCLYELVLWWWLIWNVLCLSPYDSWVRLLPPCDPDKDKWKRMDGWGVVSFMLLHRKSKSTVIICACHHSWPHCHAPVGVSVGVSSRNTKIDSKQSAAFSAMLFMMRCWQHEISHKGILRVPLRLPTVIGFESPGYCCYAALMMSHWLLWSVFRIM